MTIAIDVLKRLPEQSGRKLELIEGLALDALGAAQAAQTRLNQQPRLSPQETERLHGVVNAQRDRHLQLTTIVTACVMFVRNLHPRSVIERSDQKLPNGLNGSPLEDVKKPGEDRLVEYREAPHIAGTGAEARPQEATAKPSECIGQCRRSGTAPAAGQGRSKLPRPAR